MQLHQPDLALSRTVSLFDSCSASMFPYRVMKQLSVKGEMKNLTDISSDKYHFPSILSYKDTPDV